MDSLQWFSHRPIFTSASQEPGKAEIKTFIGQSKEDIEQFYNTTTSVLWHCIIL